MAWWVELEYPPFEEGEDGFPRTGQVVRHYREHKRDEGGRVCTQPKLAEVLGIGLSAVGEIELRGGSLDFERRQRLCQYLDIPPILLGIIMLEDILKIREQQQEEVFWWAELGHPPFALGPEYLRRQAYRDILQAQAHANLGEYPEAAGLAETALLVFLQINSEVNIARVVKIHEQLQKSPFKNNPEVARLDYLLFKK